jgi:hypothetical protein
MDWTPPRLVLPACAARYGCDGGAAASRHQAAGRPIPGFKYTAAAESAIKVCTVHARRGSLKPINLQVDAAGWLAANPLFSGLGRLRSPRWAFGIY